MKNKNNIVIVAIAAISIAIIVSGSFVSLASSQSQKPLPVLLIHGYAEDAAIWKKWEDLLKKDGIQFFTITFTDSDDKCGSAEQHAKELEKRVQDVKQQSGAQKINIVGHSKGGLDARVFLDITDTKDVANLIMIGTPNAGSPAAETNDATKAVMNPNTKYYTITGDWLPAAQGNLAIPGHDDGLVPVESVESEGYFQSLGRTEHAHAELLQEQEYNMVKDVLLGKR